MKSFQEITWLLRNLFIGKHYNKNIYFSMKNTNLFENNLYFSCSPRKYSSTASDKPKQINKMFTMKINSPEFYSVLTPEVNKLANLFSSSNYELRMVGGAVRDILNNIQPIDIDFATTATPEQMRSMFKKEGIRTFSPGGETYGTFSVRINDKQNFEITTLRIDFIRDGGECKPKFITDWRLDACRRDLTINAMFLGMDGTLYDYFNGVEDLKNKRIRFVENPEQRIKEDYLRILRYFRFYGQIAEQPNNHDPQILQVIQKNVDGLSRVTPERIYIELKKILTGRHHYDILKTMILLGIAPYIGLPNNVNVKALEDLKKRAKHFTLQPITILSSMIENIEQMEKLCTWLKFTNDEVRLGIFLINNRGNQSSTDPFKPYQTMILESTINQSHLLEWVEELLKYKGEVELQKQLREWKIPKFPVKTRTLISHGVHPSPHLRGGDQRYKRILLALKKKWIASNFTMTENQLIELLPIIVDEDNLKNPPLQKKKKKRT